MDGIPSGSAVESSEQADRGPPGERCAAIDVDPGLAEVERGVEADCTGLAPEQSGSPDRSDDDALVDASRRGAAAIEALALSWSVPIETVLRRLTILAIRGRVCRRMA